jgi:hypothetical protein
MYDGTIATDHRNYQITITATPTTVYSLLSSGDQIDYNSILTTGTQVQPLQYPSKNTDVRYRVPLDGYVVCNSGSFFAYTGDDSSKEVVSINDRYPCNVYFWPHKTYLSASVPISANARILFG